MSSVRAATALRVAARTSVVKSIARNAQQPARRYSSTQAHGSEKSSDLPWLLSALALTLPAVYMMRPSAYAHPSKEHKTAPFEAAKPEVPKSVDDAKERAAEFTETVKDTAAQATENVKEKSAEATEAVKDKAPAVSDKATAAKEKFEQTTQSRPAQEEEPKGDKGAENINDQSAFEHVKDRLENGVQRVGEKTSEIVQDTKEEAAEKTELVTKKAAEVKKATQEKASETSHAVKENVEEIVEETKQATKAQ